MCGIIGYIGRRQTEAVLLAGLRRLEYRGYDSAGVAWREDGRIECVRAIGNLDALEAALTARFKAPVPAGGAPVGLGDRETVGAGLGHTRWATHGGVTECNAHPHADSSGQFRIVMNGIIENYLELRDRLARDGVPCNSDTDAEVIAHLIALRYEGDLSEAVRQALAELEGHYAFAAMCSHEPDTLVGVRHECPLVLGIGDGEQFIASSIAAFLPHTREVAVLHDREIAVLRPGGVTVVDADGQPRPPESTEVDWDEERCEKEGFETFMLKEIHEQGTAVAETVSHARKSGMEAVLSDERIRGVRRIVIVGCGTSYHAGIAGRLAIERWARIPVEVDVASEFRYREPIVDAETLVLGITQSGETADTLAAMRLAHERGAAVIALTNVPGSQATREADAVLFTRAGLEIGVAATKTFVAQVVLLYAIALRLGRASGALTEERAASLSAQMDRLPGQLDELVGSASDGIRELAERLAWRPFFLYLGRLSGVPVALEGALKLKEISYVPTDAYAAGEMKHGPIALLSADTPVVCVATEQSVLGKLMSNLCEVRARGARVLAVATEGCKEIAEHAEHITYVPRSDPLLQVVLAIVPLQLFAYHVARTRALNVDQPRNLAKTVTVE